MQRALPLLALCGLLAFIVTVSFHGDAPLLAIDRAQAEAIADAALKERGVALGPEWKRFAAVRVASDDGAAWAWNKFVWREAGQEHAIGGWRRYAMSRGEHEIARDRGAGAEIALRADQHHLGLRPGRRDFRGAADQREHWAQGS